MFDEMRLTRKVRKVATDLFGDPSGHEPSDLVPRLEKALGIARVLASREVLTDDNDATQVARLAGLLSKILDCLPEVEAWCTVKYCAHGGDPAVWHAFLSREQAEAFAPATEKAYHRPHYPKRSPYKVERRSAEIRDFIAPTVTVAEYVAEIKRYGFGS